MVVLFYQNKKKGLLMTELTQNITIPDNVEADAYEIELFDSIPFNEEKSNEEQVFFCLGHWSDYNYLQIKKVIAIDNIADDKENFFEVNVSELEKHNNLLVAILHTHPNNTIYPSNEDKEFLPKGIIGGIYQPITNHIIWWNAYKLNL